MLFKRLVTKLVNIFRADKILKDEIQFMEEESRLREDLLIALEEENTKLKNTVVSSMDLVDNYKTGMLQMRSYLSQVMASQSSETIGENDSFDENDNEEEDDLDIYKALMKKTTIH